ncbi:MAG TPA: FecR domain-containing protein [Rhodanobacter sp.]
MSSSREIERTAATWLARRDGVHWSESDQRRLDAWLNLAVAHRVAFLRLDAAWQQSGRLKALGAGTNGGGVPARSSWSWPRSGNADAAAHTFRHTPPPSLTQRSRRHSGAERRTPRRGVFLGLAITALMALTVTLTMGWRHHTSEAQTSYHTATGDLQEVSLTDGSKVTLSSNSQILVTMSRKERHVELLQGEAFFVVAKNPARPFVVSADGRRVTAVGTRFSVRRDATELRVVVTHGLVQLESDPHPGRPRQATTLLPAGSVALASDNGVVVHSGSVQQAQEYLSWRSGFVSFHDTSLATAVAEFNRYNTRKIVIGDAQIGAMRVGGNFRWSNTDAFVRLLVQGFPIKANRRGDTIVLTRR